MKGPSNPSSQDHPDNRGVWVEMWVVDLLGGDLSAAVLLSQLLWWHQPSKSGRPKLKYERDGHRWLIRADDDWWEDCRLTLRQVRRIRDLLRGGAIVEHKVVRISGATISAWRPNLSVIQAAQERNGEEEDEAPGVTPTRHSGEGPGVTPTRHSGEVWTDASASLQSDASASLHSLLDPEDKESVAASRPQALVRAEAEEIVTAWWDAQSPTPVNSRVGVLRIVERFLQAGHSTEVVARALADAACPTVNSMLVSIKGAPRLSSNNPNVEAAMLWLNEEPASGE